MRQRAALRHALITAFAVAVLYGSTYQQFRFFSLAAPGGAFDALEYVKISRGDPGVDLDGPSHYRWVTPAAARLILPAVDRGIQDPELAVRLSFYLVNFGFSTATCVILFALLQAMGFSPVLSLLGVCAFASSRATVLVTATPMVDAVYYCAVAGAIYLIVAKRTLALVLVLPLLALSKETILPFLLLPLMTDLRRSRAYWASLAGALLLFVASTRIVDALYLVEGPSVADSVLDHVAEVAPNLLGFLTLGGIHEFQSGFSFLLPLAVIGAWLNARHRYHSVPVVVVATVPIALGLALLSGNTGRMFFASFPAVIAYALISIEHVARSYAPGFNAVREP